MQGKQHLHDTHEPHVAGFAEPDGVICLPGGFGGLAVRLFCLLADAALAFACLLRRPAITGLVGVQQGFPSLVCGPVDLKRGIDLPEGLHRVELRPLRQL